jgi:orotidine-5'-phosphate decarboxylase
VSGEARSSLLATTGLAPVAVALDTGDLPQAVRWASAVGPYVSTCKVGLQLYLGHGAAAVLAVANAAGRPVFLDLKLHDIPATVAGAARSVAALEPAFVTVHASGGPAMVRAAVESLPSSTLVTGVTVLTSLDAGALARLGFDGTALDVVRRLATLAVEAGAGALVCSPQEVAAVRAEVGPGVVLVTPGVRPVGGGADDQARVGTPEQALADGADLLVVGRPITAATDPAHAAAALAEQLAGHVVASLPPADRGQ